LESIKVFELAKKLNISTKSVVNILRDEGLTIENQNSEVDLEVAKRIEEILSDPDLIETKFSSRVLGLEDYEKIKKSAELKAKQKKVSKTQVKKDTEDKDISIKTQERPSRPEEKKLMELTVPAGITVKELAEKIGKPVSKVIKTLITLGEMITMNEVLSELSISVLGEEFGYKIDVVSSEQEMVVAQVDDNESMLEKKPPVVTIMGHVDHGKTSLLDAIRKTNIIEKEAGGITQHIGAYQVMVGGKKITFIDTPGHEAFTQMRARGAKVTDIAVIVIAANDGVMPQTIEAINHAKAAGVPIIFAINKIDLPDADIDRVKRMLADLEFTPEEWGGQAIMVEISAKKGTNLDELLEMILLVAEIQDLKSNTHVSASGVVIESRLEKGAGPIATVLIKKGTLNLADSVVAGTTFGKLRVMLSDTGKRIKSATSAQPVELVGLNALPNAGDDFFVVKSEKEARQIANERSLKVRQAAMSQVRHLTLDDIATMAKEGQKVELRVELKADVNGSIEAITESLMKIAEAENADIKILHYGVGSISESDVMLASASDALIIGFNVRPNPSAKKMALLEGVDIRIYTVIYDLYEDIKAAIKGMLKPEFEMVDVGTAEVRQTYKVSKLGIAAGCYVSEGEVRRNLNVRVIRNGKIIHDGKISSLHRFKDDVKSVSQGFECGIMIENYQDINVGDIMEFYTLQEKKR
jgi:translation initiation factor IF-2